MSRWHKLGCILSPDERVPWIGMCVGASYVEVLENGPIRVYVGGRDSEGIGRIGLVQLDPDDPRRVVSVAQSPLLAVGEIGCFDERGVSYPWIIRHEDRVFMYYTGWVAGGLGGFQNSLGLAISEDGGQMFSRYSRAPILERTDSEPIGTGSVCVRRESDRWRMWYTCFARWIKLASGNKHYYHIRYAESEDGIHWHRQSMVAIDFQTQDEYAIARPSVHWEHGLYRMYYCVRGAYYRIGYAESSDGRHWSRLDGQAGIDVSPQGWDREMAAYPCTFDHGGRTYMVYNGNGYGRAGLGLAVRAG